MGNILKFSGGTLAGRIVPFDPPILPSADSAQVDRAIDTLHSMMAECAELHATFTDLQRRMMVMEGRIVAMGGVV